MALKFKIRKKNRFSYILTGPRWKNTRVCHNRFYRSKNVGKDVFYDWSGVSSMQKYLYQLLLYASIVNVPFQVCVPQERQQQLWADFDGWYQSGSGTVLDIIGRRWNWTNANQRIHTNRWCDSSLSTGNHYGRFVWDCGRSDLSTRNFRLYSVVNLQRLI